METGSQEHCSGLPGLQLSGEIKEEMGPGLEGDVHCAGLATDAASGRQLASGSQGVGPGDWNTDSAVKTEGDFGSWDEHQHGVVGAQHKEGPVLDLPLFQVFLGRREKAELASGVSCEQSDNLVTENTAPVSRTHAGAEASSKGNCEEGDHPLTAPGQISEAEKNVLEERLAEGRIVRTEAGDKQKESRRNAPLRWTEAADNRQAVTSNGRRQRKSEMETRVLATKAAQGKLRVTLARRKRVLPKEQEKWDRQTRVPVKRHELPVRRKTSQRIKTDELMDLKVQFVAEDGNSAPTGSNSVAARKSRRGRGCKQTEKKITQSEVSARQQMKLCAATIVQMKLAADVLQQWRSIGSENQLSTDTEIAAFLVRHYKNAGQRQCPMCHSPLPLHCSNCSPPPHTSDPLTDVIPVTDVSLPKSEPSLSPPLPPSPPLVEENSLDASDTLEDESFEASTPPPVETAERLPRKRRKRGSGGRAHVCPECGSQFARSGGLKVHMRIHTGEKPYVCSECGQAFSQSGQLTVHMRKHRGERPYACSVCPASFPLAGSLKQHMRVHTGDRPYACPHCTRRFSYAGDLTVHLRKHTGDRPFLCSDCGKSFAVSSDLSKHKKIHSNHRPFKCSVCHKGFPFLNRLTLHMRTHTGDKPFLCADCGSSFSRASNLTVHRRVHHTFEKPFVCPVCQHAFADSANLSKHKKNKHGKNNSEPQPPVITADVADSSALQVSTLLSSADVVMADSVPCGGGGDGSGQLSVGVQGSADVPVNGSAMGSEAAVLGAQSGMGAVFPFYNYYYQHQPAVHHQY